MSPSDADGDQCVDTELTEPLCGLNKHSPVHHGSDLLKHISLQGPRNLAENISIFNKRSNLMMLITESRLLKHILAKWSLNYFVNNIISHTVKNFKVGVNAGGSLPCEAEVKKDLLRKCYH